MKLSAPALLLGVLWFAGCTQVKPPPQIEPAGGAESVRPAAEPNGLQGQVQSIAVGDEPNEARTQPAWAERDSSATVDPVGTVPAGVVREARTENIAGMEGLTAVQEEPVDADAPVRDKAREPGDAKPAGPNSVRPAEPNTIPSVPAEPNDATTATFTEYAEILKMYVREDGRVDYGALRRRRLDLKPLLMKLGELDPDAYQRWPRDEKLAFWINAYNLKMLDIVTRNYPIQSSWWLRLTWPPDDIRHIRGIWTDFKLVVMDEEFTLAEVGRRFFKAFDDPRVHLALTYASQSSPILRWQPYRGDKLDRQLDEQVKQFLSSPRGLQIDRRNMVVRLSALFKPTWRGKEFVARYGTDKKFKNQDAETRAVLNFITGYLTREDVYFLEVENYAIEYMNFDWRLNDTSRGY